MIKKILTLIAIVIFMLTSLFMAGCESEYNHLAITDHGKIFKYYILKIGSCEYIKFQASMSDAITHKGDCTNKIHYNKTQKELDRARFSGMIVASSD